MGYWENTIYIESGNAAQVVSQLEDLLSHEGMQRITRPPSRQRLNYEPQQYAGALSNNTWALAVFPGAAGWTIIKTAPLELLAESAPGQTTSRFVQLCERLRARGFQFHVYDSSGGVIVETDGAGRTLSCGANLSSDNPLDFHGRALSQDRFELRFEILPLQERLTKCLVASPRFFPPDRRFLDNDRLARVLAETLGGNNARYCDNLTCVHTLICRLPLEATGGFDLYYRWPAGDRPEPPARDWRPKPPLA